MKRSLLLSGVMVLLLFSLAACNRKGPVSVSESFGTSTKDVAVFRDLAVQDVMIDDFDTSKYDKDEYLSYLQEDIDAYNSTATFVPQTAAEGEEETFTPHYTVPVSVASCTAEENKINQQILYATAADFTAFNEEALEERGGHTLQAGTLPFADASVTGAALVDPDSKNGENLDVQDILTGRHADDYRFVICNFDAVLYVEGEIEGYTSNAAVDLEKNCVTVPAGETVIVVFR